MVARSRHVRESAARREKGGGKTKPNTTTLLYEPVGEAAGDRGQARNWLVRSPQVLILPPTPPPPPPHSLPNPQF